MIIGAIEAGGTKFVCGIFAVDSRECARPKLIVKTSVPTTEPGPTLEAALSFFASSADAAGGRLDSIGIGSFGPIELRPSSQSWGYITSTPKPGWRDTPLATYFRDELAVPVAFDTDVNAAAFAEYLWGAAKGLKNFVYMTVGTGIGGGVFANGELLHGLGHPELGHVMVRREASDAFPGVCPFHRDCLEGLASGPAIGGRWRADAEKLAVDHEAWELEARYLAKAFASYALVLSPERILMGGGVGLRPRLAERVSALLGDELAGYLPELDDSRLASYVARPELGAEAGLYGAAALALRYCQD